LWQTIAAFTAHGATVLLTTQYLEEADQFADRIVVIDAGRVIVSGTSDELKAQVGGDRLELRAAAGVHAAVLAAAVAELGSGPPVVDTGDGRVVLPVADGPGVLGEAVARLAASGLRVSDVALRRPSLDDVFLTLTGQPATAVAGSDLAETGSRQ
jgi:ABC-2 type transport system ATP-binding protein